MPRGLVRLAGLCDRVGGVGIIEYGEAEQIGPLLAELGRDPGTAESAAWRWRPGRSWRRGRPVPDAVCAPQDADAPGETGEGGATPRWRRVAADDSLELDDGESTALLAGERLGIVSRLGAAAWEACASPASVTEVAQALQAQFGPHPQAGQLAKQALDGLAAAGLIREAGAR